MKVSVARQPIFDRRQHVFAYDLLFRSGEENLFANADGDYASQSVISHSLHVFGFGELTQAKRAFIRVTRSLLLDQAVMLLPPHAVAVQILEALEPDDDVLRACNALKQGGFLLTLGDFVLHRGYAPLVDLADIIKVDFQKTSREQRKALAQRLSSRQIKLLADKVETREDFAEGLKLGYDYFQGYFFCKPEIVARDDVPGYKLNHLRFLREINQPDTDFGRLEDIIKQDVALSVKLLRYINSAWFGLSHRVNSIRHALVLLGARGLRQWATLVTVTSLGSDRPTELVTTCLQRAWFCEFLAPLAGLAGRESDLFLVGLLSSLDALIGRPLDELLNEIAVPIEVRDALLSGSGRLAEVYRLGLAYEQGNWDAVATSARLLGLDEDLLPAVYLQSIEQVNHIMAA